MLTHSISSPSSSRSPIGWQGQHTELHILNLNTCTFLFEMYSNTFQHVPTDGRNDLIPYQFSPILHLSYIIKGFKQAQDNNSFRSHNSSNISGMRLASASWAAVSNVMVVLRVSNSREVGISFQSQSVRYGNDLQRCEFLNRDRCSIDLIKWEALGAFKTSELRREMGVPTEHANASYP